MLRPTVSRPVCLGIKNLFGLTTRFLLLSDSCGFVDVGRSLWREDGSVVYNCCWSSPAQAFPGPSPWDSWPYFTVSDSRLPFRRHLRLAGIRWRYSTPPPHGAADCWSWSYVKTDGQAASPSLASSTHLGLDTRFLFLSDRCWFVDVGRPHWREDRSDFYSVQCAIYLHFTRY
jgi:hypothetical protein